MTRHSRLFAAATTGVLFMVGTAPLSAQRQTPIQLVQANQKGDKSQRITELKSIVANENQLIQVLESEEPPAQVKTQRKPLVDNVTKARNATLRYINDLEGRDPETGIEAATTADKTAAKKVQRTQDRYDALMQARQLLEQDYTTLSQESGAKNAHHANALKFLQQARTPLQQEIDAYTSAHPEVQVAQAQPAAAPIPGQPAPAQAQPAQNDAALTSPQRVQDLQNIIPHLEHSIDMTNAEANDAQSHRQKTLDQLVRARDTIRQMLSQAQKKSPADLAKDVQNDHTRDAARQNLNNQTGYAALQRIQQYLHNDRIVMARQTDDPQHLRATALDAMDQANAAVQQQIDDYNKAHPNEKH